MIARLLILLCCGFFCSLAAAEDTYRWEDEQGRVYYSDQPPPPGARNVRRTRVYDGGEEQVLPYRLQIAVDKFPVTLYVTDCGDPCDRARQLLIGRGVPHTLLDASDTDVQEELMGLTEGMLEVPVVEVGKTVLHGFEEGQWNSALDRAGYPTDAMIEVRPYVPVPAEQPAMQDGNNDEVAAGHTDGFDAAESEPGEIELDESFLRDIDTDELANEAADLAETEQDE